METGGAVVRIGNSGEADPTKSRHPRPKRSGGEGDPSKAPRPVRPMGPLPSPAARRGRRRSAERRIGSPAGWIAREVPPFDETRIGDRIRRPRRPPSPLVGEGARRADEGARASARRGTTREIPPFREAHTPHPTLRATFSRKGRREDGPPRGGATRTGRRVEPGDDGGERSRRITRRREDACRRRSIDARSRSAGVRHLRRRRPTSAARPPPWRRGSAGGRR